MLALHPIAPAHLHCGLLKPLPPGRFPLLLSCSSPHPPQSGQSSAMPAMPPSAPLGSCPRTRKVPVNSGLQDSAHHVHQPQEGDGSGGKGDNLGEKEVKARAPEQPSHHPDTGVPPAEGKANCSSALSLGDWKRAHGEPPRGHESPRIRRTASVSKARPPTFPERQLCASCEARHIAIPLWPFEEA